MSILSDKEIKALCQGTENTSMIFPFLENQVRKANGNPVISYGPSSYAYDITPSDDFRIFNNLNTTVIDPKHFDDCCLLKAEVKIDESGSRYIILPPNSYALAHSACRFNMPKDVLGMTVGKSSYARAGVTIPATLLQPGWSGELVLEISNSTNLPVKIYTDEGIVTIVFFGDLNPAEVPYIGLYQHQTGVKLPTV